MKVKGIFVLGGANMWNLFNKLSNRLLMYGAENGHLWVVNIFKKYANVNYINRTGVSVLLVATINNHVQIVRKLLTNGADVNHVNSIGSSALILTAGNGVIWMSLISLYCNWFCC